MIQSERHGDEKDSSSDGSQDARRWLARAVRHPLVFLAIFVSLYGFKREDFSDFALLTRDPFITHPAADRQFLHSSPLSLFIGWPLTNAFGPHASYALVCMLGFALLLAALHVYLRDASTVQRRAMVSVALSTPLLLVLSRWLGKGDPYLLGFFLLVRAFGGRAKPSAVVAGLLVFAHRELGVLMLAGDALLRWEIRRSVAVGAALGVAAVACYHAGLSVPPFSRTDFALSVMRRGLVGWEALPAAHLMLAFSWFWLVLFLRGPTPDWPRVALTILFCFVVSFDGADYTRDFILCAFPVVVYTAESVARDARSMALLTAWPIPFPFLIQLQLESFDQVTDSRWLGAGVSRLAGLLHGLL